MEQGAHIRWTAQTIAAKPSSSITKWRPASLFHNLTPHSATQYERVSSANHLVSHFDCALHNRHNVRAARTHLDTTSPKRKPRSEIAAKRDQYMRHDLSTLCLLAHTYRHICNICTRCHSRTIVEYSPPWCASGTDTGPLLIGNIPADEAPALPAPVRL